jgi:hypothetical protein
MAERVMPDVVLDHLHAEQQTLRSMQSTFPGAQHTVSTDLRELDLYVIDHTRIESLIHNFGHQLRRLRLTAATDLNWSLALANVQPLSLLLPVLRVLTLSHMDISTLFKPLFSIHSPRKLTHLRLLRCDGSDQFISDLGVASRSIRLSLQHLTVDLNRNDAVKHKAPLDACLTDVFNACGILQSLHVSWWDNTPSRRVSPRTLLDKIHESGPQLDLLSLAESDELGIPSSLPVHEFDTICCACPNILQLAYQLPEHAHTESESRQKYGKFMV